MVHLQSRILTIHIRIRSTNPAKVYSLHQSDRPFPRAEMDLLMSGIKNLLKTRILQAILLTGNWAKMLLSCRDILSNLLVCSVCFPRRFGNPRRTSFPYPYAQLNLLHLYYSGPDIPCLRINIKCTPNKANKAAGRKKTWIAKNLANVCAPTISSSPDSNVFNSSPTIGTSCAMFKPTSVAKYALLSQGSK